MVKSYAIIGKSRIIGMKKFMFLLKKSLLCTEDIAKQRVMTINPIDGPIIPYVAVLYQIDSPITEDKHTLCHGNSKENESRLYIRTSKKVLSKTKDFLKERNTCKEADDKENALSGGVYESSSQSDELRNMKQVYRQKEEMKPKAKPAESDELLTLIRYQQENTNFLRSVVCLDQSYYGFITTDTQLNDIAKLCCVENNVFSVDTTFNLCKNWLSDTCYKNTRLKHVDEKHPIFLGPCQLHFRKDTFTFN